MSRINVLILGVLVGSCTPPAEVHRPPAPAEQAAPPTGHLRLVWSKIIPFDESGTLRGRCDWPVLEMAPRGNAVFSAAQHPYPGEWRHELFIATPEGQVHATSLGPGSEPEGEVVALRFDRDRVLAASLFTEGSEPTVVLSARERVGAPIGSSLTLYGTAKAWPLSSDRWLAVGAAEPHTLTTWNWNGTGRQHRRHPAGNAGGTPAAPFDVYDVAVDGARTTWATRGLQKGDALATVSVFDLHNGLQWFLRDGAFISTDVAFDAAGNLWLSGAAFDRLRPDLGSARFPVAPELPPGVHKTFEDQPPPPKGHIRIAEPRIWSLFSHAFRYVRLMGFAPNRTIDTQSIVDGILLRYDPRGQLTLVRYYPSSAIVRPGPLLPEASGLTAVMHIEGPVPAPLRLHPDIPKGWAGMTLLVHYDARGREAWAAPLGEGERVIKHLARTADGYLTIALDEQGRCELSRWQFER